METRIVKAYGDARDSLIMAEAGEIIVSGGLVGIPTETVYGLAGDALNPLSSKKIYEAKGRPSDNPLIVHIAEENALKDIAEFIPNAAYDLIETFWPGPLTLIFKKKDLVPHETTGGLDTVAVRMPVNTIAREFIKASTGFIAAPSANSSGRPSCTSAEHVYQDLKGKIPLIIDGGKVGIGLESTILDMSSGTPTLLRPGVINIDMLQDTIGSINIDPSINGIMDPLSKPKAPGMKYKHYAPKGTLYIVRGNEDNVISCINKLCQRDVDKGIKAAVISSDATKSRYSAAIVKSAGSRTNEESLAQNLFSVLREMDDEGADIIYSEAFDTPRLGMAIMNRLIRAAAHRFIDADNASLNNIG